MHNAMNYFRCCYVITPNKMYKQSVLVSPNFNCSTEIQMFTLPAVISKDKFVINIVVILIAERDSSTAEGHNSSYRKALNQHQVLSWTKCVHY